MPDQTDQAPDPRDARIAELEMQLKAARSDNDDLNEHLDQLADEHEVELKKLSAQLAKAGKLAPSEDHVVLGGKTYSVVTTVRANTTFDEVKKGHVDEGVTLVVIDAPH